MDDMGGWMDRMDGCGWTGGWMDQVGLSTSSSRFSKKFHVISQNVAQKLLFVTKVAQKFLEKNKYSLGSDAKICKLYSKNKISKHFCEILGRNQRFPAIFISWERISRKPAKTSREA